MAFSNTRETLSLLSEDGYFGNRLRYHASCQSVSHYQLKHYSGQPEDQFPVSTYLLTYFAFGSAISAIWLLKYRKIPKISPGAYIFQRPFLRGLSTEGNLRFKIDWASLIAGSKFTVLALFVFVFEGNFPSTSSRGLIFGGAI